jgi:hypothetical protein
LNTFEPQAYGQSGLPLWTNTYIEPGNFGGAPQAITVDGSGNVFVTGSYRTSTFTGANFATVAYSNTGVPLWTNLYNGSTAFSGASSIAADGSGNVVVAGNSDNGLGSNNYFDTIKISSAGVPLWTNRYPAVGPFVGTSLGVDASGTVFVATFSGIAVYSSGGALLWSNNDVSALAAAVDASGDLIVTEQANNGIGLFGYKTSKFSSDRLPLWTNFYLEGYSSIPRAIAVDTDGNVFVTGTSFTGTNYYFSTMGYSGAGMPLWTNRYNRPGGGGDDRASAIAVDGSGNVFVTGRSSAVFNSSVFTDFEYATVAYSRAGMPLWTNLYNNRPAGSIPSAIVADSNGHVFVTGISYYGFTTVAYSAAGVPLWTNAYFDAQGDPSIATDRAGNVFITGQSALYGQYHYTTLKYSSSILARLDFQRLNTQIVLTWTNAGFNLQFAPSAAGTFTNIPGATSPHTNDLLGAGGYFRLQGP